MEKNYISQTEQVSGGFFMPPPLSPNENAKTLSEWFENTSRLCDTITNKTIFVFRLYRSPDKNYIIYLALAKHSEDRYSQFDYISAIGNSYKIPDANSEKITPDQIIKIITSEFVRFSSANTQAASIFEKAELVTVTHDNYEFTKLLPK